MYFSSTTTFFPLIKLFTLQIKRQYDITKMPKSLRVFILYTSKNYTHGRFKFQKVGTYELPGDSEEFYAISWISVALCQPVYYLLSHIQWKHQKEMRGGMEAHQHIHYKHPKHHNQVSPLPSTSVILPFMLFFVILLREFN